MVTKGVGDNLVRNKFTISFFSRKLTFVFAFQEKAGFTFTSLVLKRHNVNSSLRD